MREVYTISGRVTHITSPLYHYTKYIYIRICIPRASVKFSLVNYVVAAPRPKIAAKGVNETINTYYASLNGARGLPGIVRFLDFSRFPDRFWAFRVGFDGFPTR